MSNTRVGLWKKESAKGNVYLSGADKEAGVRYMVFKDEDGTRRLVTKPLADNDAPLKDVVKFESAETKEGANYYRATGYSIFANDYFEEGSNKPEFNLVINAEG